MIKFPKGFTSDLPHIVLPPEFIFEYKEGITYPLGVSHLNFSKSEIDSFITNINNTNPQFHPAIHITGWTLEDRAHFVKTEPMVEGISAGAIAALQETFEIAGQLVRSHFWITSYDAAAAFHVHSDNGGDSEKGNIHNRIFQTNRKFTAVFYLNSKDDFTGGDLLFPSIFDEAGNKLRIKPDMNMLLVFPSNVFYRHGIERIKSGNRTIIGMTFDVV